MVLRLNGFFLGFLYADHVFFLNPSFTIILKFVFSVLSKSEKQTFWAVIVVEDVYVADLFLYLFVGQLEEVSDLVVGEVGFFVEGGGW